VGRRFLSLVHSWLRVACGVTPKRERERERERTRKNVKGKRTGTSEIEGGILARKWTRIGALCENEKVTKAEGKDVHIYA